MTIEGSHPVTEDVNRIDIDDEAVTAGDELTADDAAATPDLDEAGVVASDPDVAQTSEEQTAVEAADADLAIGSEYVTPSDEASTTPSDDEYLEMESMQGDGELPIDMGHDAGRPDDTADTAVVVEEAPTEEPTAEEPAAEEAAAEEPAQAE
jgi:hypothetical protein